MPNSTITPKQIKMSENVTYVSSPIEVVVVYECECEFRPVVSAVVRTEEREREPHISDKVVVASVGWSKDP